MAKRRRKEQSQSSLLSFFDEHRNKLFWGVVVVVSFLFGYSRATGAQGWYGIMIGVLYGIGALLAIGAAYYINRKLKGL